MAAQVDHSQPAGAGVDDRDAPAWVRAKEVERPEDPGLLVQVVVGVSLLPDVVAGSDDVDAGGQQRFRVGGLDALPIGRVLAVGHDRVGPVPVLERGQLADEGLAPRFSHHVCEKQDDHADEFTPVDLAPARLRAPPGPLARSASLVRQPGCAAPPSCTSPVAGRA